MQPDVFKLVICLNLSQLPMDAPSVLAGLYVSQKVSFGLFIRFLRQSRKCLKYFNMGTLPFCIGVSGNVKTTVQCRWRICAFCKSIATHRKWCIWYLLIDISHNIFDQLLHLFGQFRRIGSKLNWNKKRTEIDQKILHPGLFHSSGSVSYLLPVQFAAHRAPSRL